MRLKLLLVPLVFIFLLSLATALTINGTVDFVSGGTLVHYTHTGLTTGLQQITVTATNINFNKIGDDLITLESLDGYNMSWAYNTSSKKLYINKTIGRIDVDGTTAFMTTSSGLFEVLKYNGSSYILYDDGIGTGSYVLTSTDIGSFLIQPNTVLDELGNYSYDYDAITYETERVAWNLTLKDSIADEFYNMLLFDDYGHNYSTSYIINGTNRIYYANFNIPVNPVNNTNVTFWWSGYLYTGGTLQSEQFNSSVNTIDLLYNVSGSCSGGIITLTLIDEDNLSSTYYVNMSHYLVSIPQFTIDYWVHTNINGDYYIEESWNPVNTNLNWFGTLGTSYKWCVLINPARHVHINLFAKFELPAPQTIDPNAPALITTIQNCVGDDCSINQTTLYTYNNDSFTQRLYMLNANLVSSAMFNYIILNPIGYKAREVVIYNSASGQKIENLYVYMYRFYGASGWIRVQTGKTDSQGKTLFYVKDGVNDYKFSFVNPDGSEYETTPVMRFDCPSNFCSTSFYTNPDSVNTSNRPVLNSQVTYNNVTSIVTSRWFVDDNRELEVTLTVSKITSTGDFVICNETTTSISGVYYCDISGHTGSIVAVLTSNFNGETVVEQSATYQTTNIGLYTSIRFEEAAFWAFIILLIITFAALHSPVSALVAMIFGLIFISFMGLLSGLTGVVIISAGVIAAIISFKVKS